MLPEVRAENAQGWGSDNEQRATKARGYRSDAGGA